jgi:uncharacterized MAPEG superfamily protein
LSQIATRQAAIREFAYPEMKGRDWYKRAMRAHGNCVENLPVYGAVVVAIVASGIRAPMLDLLACVMLGARVVHSVIHVAFEQTSKVLVARSSFFTVQIVCIAWMGIHVALEMS